MVTNDNLTSSDLAVLEHLSDTPQAISQREIARRSGLSLGLINAILKKLVRTGLVKTSSLNRRSIQYILTPQGFYEKAQKSYHYIMDTVRRYREIRGRLVVLLEKLVSEGVTEFYLLGDGDLAEVVAKLFKEMGFGAIKRGLPKRGDGNTVILNAAELPSKNSSYRVMDLFHELGNGNNMETK
jgi:DNA-binding MarR family transcriptional regulator